MHINTVNSEAYPTGAMSCRYILRPASVGLRPKVLVVDEIGTKGEAQAVMGPGEAFAIDGGPNHAKPPTVLQQPPKSLSPFGH